MTTTALMSAMRESLVAELPSRKVRSSLPPDPAALSPADLRKGVLCVISQGGGNFLNYQGREGDGGDADLTLVGFVQVPEKSDGQAVEDAELELLQDVLTWCKKPKEEPLDSVVPLNWHQSQQLEHPFGWIVMKLKVRWV